MSRQDLGNARRATATALLLFVVLSLIGTYPLPLHVADAVEDRQDALLNVWIMAWDQHQLLADPVHLFDANIFHPYPRTLAYSELLLGNALLALPLTAISGNPLLSYNLVLLLSFALSGLGAYLLVQRLTRSPAAGLGAGIIFAFSAYRLTNLAQAQLLATQWLPLALLSLHQLLRRPRPRHAATFALFFCLQALSSFYYGLLLALAAAALVLWELGLHLWPRFTSDPSRLTNLPSSARHLGLSAILCALAILPFARPYFQVQRELGFERSLADSEPFSASLGQYTMVAPRNLLLDRWLPSDETPIAGGYPVDALFPGLASLGLAAWGLIRGRGRSRWFFLLLALAALLLSLGPRLYLAPGQPAGLDLALPYAWLYALVPGFKALRAPARFDVLVTLSLAVLAGFGLAQIEARTASRKWGALAVALCCLLLAAESLVWPAARVEPMPVGDEVPAVYHWLVEQPAGPILELPMAFTPGGPQLEYQYFSTYHWRTTPDGYSGFVPAKHGQIVYELARFPSERSVSLLQALAVDHVVVHTDRYPAERWTEMQAALGQVGDLEPIASLGADRVYRIRPRPFEAEALVLDIYLPPRAAAGQAYTAYLIARNEGRRSYAIEPTRLLRPRATWQQGPATESQHPAADFPLVTSPQGGTAVVPLPLTAPNTPGTWQLTLSLTDKLTGDWQLQGTVEVGEQGTDALPVPAMLADWHLPAHARPGGTLQVDLSWQALGKIDAYYSLYVKVLDGQGQAIAGWDGQPRDGQAPTLLWMPGETIEDAVSLPLPADAPAGDYRVEVGLYRARDLARCLFFDPGYELVDRMALGTVRLAP